jgi:putative nucleotidyltransferase with HDIG domain
MHREREEMRELFRMLTIIDLMRDNYNHHASRVAEYTLALATAMGLPDLDEIEAGAHLHDIGKLLVPKELLNAPRKLGPEEAERVHQHALLGWTAVMTAGYSPIVLGMVRHHHEKWDGTGYPDGLSALQIPLGARLLAICDVYDALTNQRTYRDRYTYNFTKSHMQGLSGRDFDPEILEVFFGKIIPAEEAGKVDG